MDRIQLNPSYSVSRIIKGGWHLAGGHGRIDAEDAIHDMLAFVAAGITTFDCADIYTGVEELIGKFLFRQRDAFASGNLPPVQIHTKYVPDYAALASVTRQDTERIIDRSLRRLQVEVLDLVQFAWWDYRFEGYIETAGHLTDLVKKGKIRFLGITNFDGRRTRELLDAGMPVLTHQLQYSVLDRRPDSDLFEVAKSNNIHYLCYGALAGGFLSDKYLGTKEPVGDLENRSLIKYHLIIGEFGSWKLFQRLLQVLKKIGLRYGLSIAEVAMWYVLQKPLVASLIIGVRHPGHLQSLRKLGPSQLDGDDLSQIDAVVSKSKGPSGPVYDLERDKNGKHGRIMRYNLNNPEAK